MTAQGADGATADGVRCEIDDAVATVTLCRPEKRNAQDGLMWARLRTIGQTLPASVRVVRIMAEGPAFSAGIDRAAFRGETLPGGVSFPGLAAMPDAEADAAIAAAQAAFTWLRRPELLTMAVVQGHAIGAGFQLALAADFRLVADDAQFTMAETSLGVVPDLTGTKPLVELVGYSRALEICVTGRRVGAAEAERIGLANLVVPAAQLADASADLCGALLASPRRAVTETKALLLGAADRSLEAQLALERAAQLRRFRDLLGMGE